jgi:hypothetical protein
MTANFKKVIVDADFLTLKTCRQAAAISSSA